MNTTFTLTAEQLHALILAAQDGALTRRTARQERNRRYYEAAKLRKAGAALVRETAAPVSSFVAPLSTPDVTLADGAAGGASFGTKAVASASFTPITPVLNETLSDVGQMQSVAGQMQSVAPASEAGPSPSLPPSPPFPRPLSSTPTPTPPSAAAYGAAAAAATSKGPGQAARQGRRRRGEDRSPKARSAAAATGARLVGGHGGKGSGEDESWLGDLEQDARFRDVPVRDEFARMRTWFAARGLRPTRRAFESWLARYEAPLQLPATASAGVPNAASKPMAMGAAAAASFFAGTAAETFAQRTGRGLE